MTPEQCRSARAWLNLTQADFVKEAGVSLSTLKDFEGGKRAPIQATLAAMKAALEKRGVVFVDGADTSGITVDKPRSTEAT